MTENKLDLNQKNIYRYQRGGFKTKDLLRSKERGRRHSISRLLMEDNNHNLTGSKQIISLQEKIRQGTAMTFTIIPLTPLWAS